MVEKIVDIAKKMMQPLITIVAVVIILRLLNMGFDPDLMFKLAAGILIFWFGYTGLKNFNFNKDDSKKADAGTAPAEQKQETVENYTPPVIWNPNNPTEVPEPEDDIPLDEDAFIAAIEDTTSIIQRSGVVNDSTIFYNARYLFNEGWKFHDELQVKTAAEITLEYARTAMASIWWKGPTAEQLSDPVTYAINNMNNDAGCTTCVRTCTYPTLRFKAIQNGVGYYTSLNDVLDCEEYLGIERDPSLIGH